MCHAALIFRMRFQSWICPYPVAVVYLLRDLGRCPNLTCFVHCIFFSCKCLVLSLIIFILRKLLNPHCSCCLVSSSCIVEKGGGGGRAVKCAVLNECQKGEETEECAIGPEDVCTASEGALCWNVKFPSLMHVVGKSLPCALTITLQQGHLKKEQGRLGAGLDLGSRHLHWRTFIWQMLLSVEIHGFTTRTCIIVLGRERNVQWKNRQIRCVTNKNKAQLPRNIWLLFRHLDGGMHFA